MPDVIVASKLETAVRMYTPGTAVFYDVVGVHDPNSLAVAGVGVTYGVDQATFDAWVTANPDAAPLVKVVTQSDIDYYNDPANTHGYELGLEPQPGPPKAPVNTVAPRVSQTAMRLDCTQGTWDGAPTGYAYQWTIDGANVGTNNASYTVVAANVGKIGACAVTATNDVGSTAALPSNGVTILGAPVSTGTPAVLQAGAVINCSTGTWSGTPTSYAYQWKMDAANVGTNAATYAVQAADYGKTATCVVTATNAQGSTAAPATAGIVVTNPNPTAAVLKGGDIADPAALLTTLETLADAGFAITINGTARQIGPIDFHGADSLGYIALLINAALGLEATCAASGNAVAITTAATGTAATITYASAPASGTDISATCNMTAATGATITNGT